MQDKVTLAAADGPAKLLVYYSALGAPRRATLYPDGDDAAALVRLGGLDLIPEPGSSAERYDDKLREHPNRYAGLAALGGAAKVLVPILLTFVVVHIAINIAWPQIPFPDLPSVPWPDIPAPDLPDWQVPDRVWWVLDKAKYVWPVVVAYVIARAEIKRRRDRTPAERRQVEGVLREPEQRNRDAGEAGRAHEQSDALGHVAGQERVCGPPEDHRDRGHPGDLPAPPECGPDQADPDDDRDDEEGGTESEHGVLLQRIVVGAHRRQVEVVAQRRLVRRQWTPEEGDADQGAAARDQTGRGGEPRRTSPGQPAAGHQGRDEQDAEDDVEPDQRVREPGSGGERIDRLVEGRVPVDGDDQVGDALGQHGQRSHHRQQRSPEPAGVVGAAGARCGRGCGCGVVAMDVMPSTVRPAVSRGHSANLPSASRPVPRRSRCIPTGAGPRCDAGRVTERNVLGGELEPCGTDPMTGFFRDGCCNTGAEDLGSHTICAVVTEEFLAHQRSIGNDLITPMPEYSLPRPGARRPVVRDRGQLGARPPRRGGRTGGAGLDQRGGPRARAAGGRCGSTPSTYRTTSASSTARRPGRGPSRRASGRTPSRRGRA